MVGRRGGIFCGYAAFEMRGLLRFVGTTEAKTH